MALLMLATSVGSASFWINVAGILVVVAAILFSGYGIAFAKKRISDVAPILICAFLLAAAGEIAKRMLAG